ncbi:MAG: TetR/AcrR family transcriptional regulator [Rhodospirillaceae bacterium]|nr:TetR/AcrR family transcriptional regulator [Rhodospirillaceae bacterium]
MAETERSRADGRQQRRRDQVMDAAAAVFAEKGFHAATTKDIADRLGLLPGSLYYYFDSKEAALVEICRRRGKAFNARLNAILSGPGDLAAKVRAGIAQHLAHNRADLVSTIAHSQGALPPAATRELKTLGRTYERLWEGIFKTARDRGELPAGFDCHAATIGLLAICNGAIHWYEKKPESEIAAIADRFANLFLNGVLPR